MLLQPGVTSWRGIIVPLPVCIVQYDLQGKCHYTNDFGRSDLLTTSSKTSNLARGLLWGWAGLSGEWSGFMPQGGSAKQPDMKQTQGGKRSARFFSLA